MSRQLSPIASLVLAIVVCTPAFSQSDHIVDQHIKAVGGADAIANVKTIVRSGSTTMSGPFGEFSGTNDEQYAVGEDKGYSEIDVKVFSQQSGWVGEKGWQKNSTEGLRDLGQGELGLNKISASLSFVADIRQQYGLVAFEQPSDAKFNNKDCVVVGVHESPVAFYLNKETKLIEGIAVESVVNIFYEDYKAFDGVQLATKVTTFIPSSGIEVVSEYDKIEINGDVDQSKFEKP